MRALDQGADKGDRKSRFLRYNDGTELGTSCGSLVRRSSDQEH